MHLGLRAALEMSPAAVVQLATKPLPTITSSRGAAPAPCAAAARARSGGPPGAACRSVTERKRETSARVRDEIRGHETRDTRTRDTREIERVRESKRARETERERETGQKEPKEQRYITAGPSASDGTTSSSPVAALATRCRGGRPVRQRQAQLSRAARGCTGRRKVDTGMEGGRADRRRLAAPSRS